jgi:thiol-disulfide isomerase/thioredoxin
MKKQFLSSFFILFITFLIGQNRSIQFETNSFSEILAKAKKENKLVFLDAYTTWCGPCKWMSKNIFTNDNVADYFNSNFVNAKFDMEKGEGIDLAKKYNVRCYPNLLFLDGDGNLVHRSAGASRDESDYISLGEIAKDPTKNYASIETQFNTAENKSPLLIAKYIDAISKTCIPYNDYIDLYYKTISENDMTNQISWNIFYNHVYDYMHVSFQHLLKNQEKYTPFYKDSVNRKIINTLKSSGDELLYSKEFSQKRYDDFTSYVKSLNFTGKEGVLFSLHFFQLLKDEKFMELFDYGFKNVSLMSIEEKNSICWDVYEKSNKKEHINAAILCMQDLTNSQDGKEWMFYDTYASLLYKAKNKKEAQKIAQEAIEIAKKTGVSSEDYKVTEDLLKEIKKLK